MSSRFWWKLRRMWHGPQMWMEGYQPDCFWGRSELIGDWKFKFDIRCAFLWGKEHGDLRQRVYLTLKRYFIGSLIRIKRRLLYLQPLRCNGNKGGWRTGFCDWLEDKARAAEEREWLKKQK